MKEKKKLNIAVFHLGFFFSGGGEKLVLEEAKGLIQRGHKVSLFAPVVDRQRCFPDMIKKYDVHSLFIPFSFRFPLRDFIAIVGAVFLTPFTFFRFVKYDVLFGANQPGPLICYFLSKILNKPYVIYLAQPTRLVYPRKIDLNKGFGKGSFDMFFLLSRVFRPLVLYLDHLSIRGADEILVNGKYMVGIIRKVYGVKGTVCPAGCYPSKKIANRKRRWEGKTQISSKLFSKPYVLVSNRHFPQKRIDYAIRVLDDAIKTIPNLFLVITGEPTKYTKELRALAQKLGLEENIIFTGLVSEKVLHNLYKYAALYLYTSPEEDFGMGVIEAMAAAVPVIAWNKAGPSATILNGKTGYLIRPYSQNVFSKRSISLLKDIKKNLQMGKNAHKHVHQNYSYNRHIDIVERKLLDVVNHHE